MAKRNVSCGIGISFGTQNTSVMTEQGEVLYHEPTSIAIDHKTGEVAAVGHEAHVLLMHGPDRFTLYYPIENGRVQDNTLARTYLRHVMISAGLGKRIQLASFSVPCGLDAREQRTFEELGSAVGIKHVYLVEAPVAAALGAGMNVMEPKGHLVVDMGAGHWEVAVASMMGVAAYCTLKMSGIVQNELICGLVEEKYGVHIGHGVAEEVKLLFGTGEGKTVMGRSLKSGLPEETYVHSAEFASVEETACAAVLDGIEQVLCQTSPELVADIADTGILFCGGSSLMPCLYPYIEANTGLLCAPAPEPFLVNGIGAALYGKGIRMRVLA